MHRANNRIGNSLVSVIMPMYNSSRFLEDAIRSIAIQTHRNMEVIIVDDGSTDHSLPLAHNLLRELSLDGHVIPRPATLPRGPGACRNFGVSLARGDYLAFLDSDDIWIPHHVAAAVASLKSTWKSEVGVYAALGEPLGGNPSGETIPVDGFPATGVVATLQYLLEGMFIPTVTLCVKAGLFRETSGFSQKLRCYEDWWLVLQLAQRSDFFLAGTVDCQIRVSSQSLTRSFGKDTQRPIMSPRMYADQIRLYGNAKSGNLLAPAALKRLRTSIVRWNVIQLADHLSALHLRHSGSIMRALASASFSAPDVVLSVFCRALAQTGRRGVDKLARVGGRPQPRQ